MTENLADRLHRGYLLNKLASKIPLATANVEISRLGRPADSRCGMLTSLVMTILGPDRSGLVKILSDAVASEGGNWLESRMARLAGQFAGIARVECTADQAPVLIARLQALASQGLIVQAVRETTAAPETRQTLTVDVIGNDRPGIVRELAAAIASAGGNVEELTTGLESAPMAGHPIFRVRGIVSVREDSDAAKITAAIEHLGSDLSVDIS